MTPNPPTLNPDVCELSASFYVSVRDRKQAPPNLQEPDINTFQAFCFNPKPYKYRPSKRYKPSNPSVGFFNIGF